MKLHMIAVYDTAAKAYNRPMFVPSRGLAIRSFQDEIKRDAPENVLNKHPEDFLLVHVADWDDDTGTATPLTSEIIARGQDFKQ